MIMEKFKPDVWNRLHYTVKYIASELESSRVGLRKWIAIYPVEKNENTDYKYTLLEFELEEELIDEYFGEEDKLNQKRYNVTDEKELISLLEGLGISLEKFTYPWRCDYPL